VGVGVGVNVGVCVCVNDFETIVCTEGCERFYAKNDICLRMSQHMLINVYMICIYDICICMYTYIYVYM